MNASQAQALHGILLGVLEAVKAGGTAGAAAGLLFAAMQCHGATLTQYQNFMTTIVGMGFVVQAGDCYHITALGEQRLALQATT